IADINAALNGLTFTPEFDYTGPAGLTITTNDQGNLGAGGPMSATDGVAITVTNSTPAPANLQVSPNPLSEGGTVTLSGDIVNPAPLDTHTVLIEWGDGSDPTTLELGVGVGSFQASHPFRDDAGAGASTTFTITVTITDDDGASGGGTTGVTVNNVAPTVGGIGGPASGVRGQALAFVASFADVGALDTHMAEWSWGDGTTSVGTVTEAAGAGSVGGSHVFTASGVYTVSLTVTDKDGGTTTVSRQVAVVAAELQPDTSDPTKTALVVGGTTGSDVIRLNPVSGGHIEVTINDVAQGAFAPTGRIIVYGQAGDDDIKLAGSIANDAWLYGGAGNDVLMGGAGNNVALGEDGDDTLLGSLGRNLLIGGAGADKLIGRPGDDILVGGSTTHDANETALLAIMAEWTSGADYQTRIAHLRGTTPGGLNGSYVLDAATVIDDLAPDRLHGSGGLDWFFTGVGDVVSSQAPDEELN
ncbi:MAG TPA: PKD domain-containing protein, partial [Gemmataceae bacterium]|nr:PKD domain-containing protein [Gemmataceae bacterium]